MTHHGFIKISRYWHTKIWKQIFTSGFDSESDFWFHFSRSFCIFLMSTFPPNDVSRTLPMVSVEKKSDVS